MTSRPCNEAPVTIRGEQFRTRIAGRPWWVVGIYSAYVGAVLGQARWSGDPLLPDLPAVLAWTIDVFLVVGGVLVVLGSLSRRPSGRTAETMGWWLLVPAYAGLLIPQGLADSGAIMLMVFGILRISALLCGRRTSGTLVSFRDGAPPNG